MKISARLSRLSWVSTRSPTTASIFHFLDILLKIYEVLRKRNVVWQQLFTWNKPIRYISFPKGLLTPALSRSHPSLEANFPAKQCQAFLWSSSLLNCAVKVKVSQSCLTLCDLMDYAVHGILQARILEWGAFPFFRGSSHPGDWTQVCHIAGRLFTSWATREAQEYWNG